jgi:hypothetical protein
MSSKEATASYVEQASHIYSLFVDAYASANQRGLEYAKSLWAISSKPYSTTDVQVAVQEGFDRANQIVSLSVAQLQTNGQKSAEFAETLVADLAKLQESYTHSLKGLVDTGISNINYVKDTATAQFEDFTKRVEDIQKTAVSAN